jgi:hypothetical protein
MKMMTAAAAAATIITNNNINNKQVSKLLWLIFNRCRAADGREFKPPCQSTGRIGHHQPTVRHMW